MPNVQDPAAKQEQAYAWILESDIYRLRKALWACTSSDERPRLEAMLARKQRRLTLVRRPTQAA